MGSATTRIRLDARSRIDDIERLGPAFENLLRIVVTGAVIDFQKSVLLARIIARLMKMLTRLGHLVEEEGA